MTNRLLKNANLVLQQGVAKGWVRVQSGLIAEVGIGPAPATLESASTLDLESFYLAPGLIDLHIHGSAGVDVLTAATDDWSRLSQFLLRQGVTGYFPTLVPVADDEYTQILASIELFRFSGGSPGQPGARILGVHFEGPFVSFKRCGALHPAHFRTYDGDPSSLELFTLAKTAAGGKNARCSAVLMTLAPEIEGGIDLIRHLSAQGVRVFIGHSVACLDTLDLALEAGARHITHFPNALEPMHHRNPGAVGWGLLRDDVSVDCIADFHHAHPLMLKLCFKSKGPDMMALISDAIPPTGLGDGVYDVWGDRIEVRNGRTSVAGQASSDTIAGSVITLLDAVKNTVDLGIPLHCAINMASFVPARAAAVDVEYGSIEPGKRADLIVLDADLNVRLSMVGGELAFDAR